jgi:hypothetical protein
MKTRKLKSIELYCPEYKTNATISVVEKHPPTGTPHLVVNYESGGHEGKGVFAAGIPDDWGDDDLVELIFLPIAERKDRNWPAWEVPSRDWGSPRLFRFWKGEKP